MRQRRQRDVAKENDFYLQILQQALPQETVTPPVTESTQPPPTQVKKVVHTSNVKEVVHLQNGHIGIKNCILSIFINFSIELLLQS